MTLFVQGQVFCFCLVLFCFSCSALVQNWIAVLSDVTRCTDACILDLSRPSSGFEEGLDWRASLELFLDFLWKQKIFWTLRMVGNRITLLFLCFGWRCSSWTKKRHLYFYGPFEELFFLKDWEIEDFEIKGHYFISLRSVNFLGWQVIYCLGFDTWTLIFGWIEHWVKVNKVLTLLTIKGKVSRNLWKEKIDRKIQKQYFQLWKYIYIFFIISHWFNLPFECSQTNTHCVFNQIILQVCSLLLLHLSQ